MRKAILTVIAVLTVSVVGIAAYSYNNGKSAKATGVNTQVETEDEDNVSDIEYVEGTAKPGDDGKDVKAELKKIKNKKTEIMGDYIVESYSVTSTPVPTTK